MARVCNKSYQIVADEDEMKWFFENILDEPKDFESYIVCLSARAKMLTEEERTEYRFSNNSRMLWTEVVRKKDGSWDFDIYKQAPYKFNCSYNAMLTKNGKPYPEKSLVCYAYFNPSNELACGRDTVEHYVNIQNELIKSYENQSEGGIESSIKKLSKVFEHFKSCHATNVSRRVWRDFDIDIEAPNCNIDKDVMFLAFSNAIRLVFTAHFGKGNFAIIKTTNGFHVLVRVSSMKGDPLEVIAALKCTTLSFEGFYGEISSLTKEIKMTEKGSAFIPLPGTLQYKNLVTVMNKDDFSYS